MQMTKNEIPLDGSPDVYISVHQPFGGRYVCDIEIETNDHEIHLFNMHCDVAETLRDRLSVVLKAFSRGYE